MKQKLKTFFTNHWQFILAFILIIWAFKRWFGLGMITWGDWWPESLDTYSSWVKPSLWSHGKGLGSNMLDEFSAPLWVSTFTLAGWLIKIFSAQYASIEKVIWFWPYIFIAPFSFYFFWRTFFPQYRLGLFAAVLLFTINTYSMLLTMGGHINLAIVYALVPTFLALVKRYIDQPNTRTGVFLGLLTTFSLFYEIRGLMVVTGLVIIYLIFFLPEIGWKKALKVLSWFFIPPILLNLWWVLPFLFQGKRAILPLTYDLVLWVTNSSYTDLPHALTLFHPQWFDNVLGKINPIPTAFFLLPIAAFFVLIYHRRFKYALFFIFIGLLAVFLAKGANPPLGRIYIELFEHFPGFKAFRDPAKFFVIVGLSYSVILGLAIETVWQIGKSKFIKQISVIIISLVPILLLWPVYSQKINGTFDLVKQIPKKYQILEKQLKADEKFYRTLWLPKKQRFGYSSETHPKVSAEFEINNNLYFLDSLNKRQPENLLTHPLSPEFLADAGIKYIIVPDDDSQDIYKDFKSKVFYEKFLANQKWLKKVSDQPFTTYEILNPQDLFYQRSHWLFTNTFDHPLLQTYLKVQKQRPALMLATAKNASKIMPELSSKQPYFFRLYASDKNIDQYGNTLINFQTIRQEPSTLVMPTFVYENAKNWKIDDKPLNLPATNHYNESYLEIPLEPLNFGEHKLTFQAKLGKNLFEGGEIKKATFVSQSDLCVEKAIESFFSNTQIAPGSLDGTEFVKIRSYGYRSCLARRIFVPEGQDNFRLSFDYQYKLGKPLVAAVIESSGVNHIIDLSKEIINHPEKANTWQHWTKSFQLKPETSEVTVILVLTPHEKIGEDGPSETWVDNIEFRSNQIQGNGEIILANLPALSSEPPAKISYKKISNHEYEITLPPEPQSRLIAYNTKFHPDWVLTDGQKTVKSVATNVISNGFILEPNTSGRFRVYFSIMKYAKVGFWLSLIALVMLIYLLVKPRKNVKFKSQNTK